MNKINGKIKLDNIKCWLLLWLGMILIPALVTVVIVDLESTAFVLYFGLIAVLPGLFFNMWIFIISLAVFLFFIRKDIKYPVKIFFTILLLLVLYETFFNLYDYLPF